MSKGSDKNKLILVIVLFVLAAMVLAWNMNWLSFGGSGTKTAAPTPSNNTPGDAGAVSPEAPAPGNRRQAPQ